MSAEAEKQIGWHFVGRVTRSKLEAFSLVPKGEGGFDIVSEDGSKVADCAYPEAYHVSMALRKAGITFEYNVHSSFEISPPTQMSLGLTEPRPAELHELQLGPP